MGIAYFCEYRGPQFKHAIHQGYGPVAGRVVRVFLVRFVDEAGSASAPGRRSIVIFGHNLKQGVYQVV